MRIKHDGKDYLIQFYKQHIVHKKGKKKTGSIRTLCKIFELNDGIRTELSHGQVTQFHKDQYDKIIGKKLALQSMLDYMAVCSTGPIHDKEFRTKIWKSFREMFGGWCKPQVQRARMAVALRNAKDAIKALQEEHLLLRIK
jgi:hypothetical protein